MEVVERDIVPTALFCRIGSKLVILKEVYLVKRERKMQTIFSKKKSKQIWVISWKMLYGRRGNSWGKRHVRWQTDLWKGEKLVYFQSEYTILHCYRKTNITLLHWLSYMPNCHFLLMYNGRMYSGYPTWIYSYFRVFPSLFRFFIFFAWHSSSAHPAPYSRVHIEIEYFICLPLSNALFTQFFFILFCIG